MLAETRRPSVAVVPALVVEECLDSYSYCYPPKVQQIVPCTSISITRK